MKRLFALLLVLAASASLGVGAGPRVVQWPDTAGVGYTAPPNGWLPPLWGNQVCDATNGCPNPNGAIVIDPWPTGWAKVPGGSYDADASILDSSTVNAADDYIGGISSESSSMTAMSITTSTAQYSFIPAVGAANVADKLFCRCNASPYARSTDDTCGAGTSTSILSSVKPEPVIFEHTSAGTARYFFAGVSSYNGCNSSNHTMTTLGPIPVALASGDRMQWAGPQPHFDTFYYRWLAQRIVEARWEEVFYPRTNMLGGLNGYGENSTTGWTSVTTGSATLTTGSFSPAVGGATLNAIRGKSIRQNTRTAGDSIQYRGVAVTAGKPYTVRGFTRFTNGTLSSNPVTVQVADGTSHSALTSAEWTAYWINGYDQSPAALTTGQLPAYACQDWCEWVINFTPATSTTVDIQILGLTQTDSLFVDEVVMFPALFSDQSLHYVFTNVGNQRFAIETDSRGLDANAALGERINKALDTILPQRPYFTTVYPFASANYTVSGRSLNTAITSPYFPGFSKIKPTFGIIHLGVNDLGRNVANNAICTGASAPAACCSGSGAGTCIGSWNPTNLTSAATISNQLGVIPVVILEPPYRGNTASPDPSAYCGTGANCTTDEVMWQTTQWLHTGGPN